ncbi:MULTISPECIES: helix-turn-helix domain-containing protein [unclassified Novosphingobium]|uniref:helix-turn-helix domain-containing protein n=1 Tax=unclassified Novosphingobium TaxID=2644732 RepID=UPI000D319D28|nr:MULTISPECIES: helix-turn-helix domain-containing protein [unclassified Novosphingobium]
MGLQHMGEISPSQCAYRGKFREFPEMPWPWDIAPMDDEEKIAAIRQFIVDVMTTKDMSRRALSSAAGLSESAVRDVLGRTTNPGIGTLYKISEGLGVSFEEMMAAGSSKATPPLSAEALAPLLDALIPLAPPSGRLTEQSRKALAEALAYGLSLLGGDPTSSANEGAVAVAARAATSRFREIMN